MECRHITHLIRDGSSLLRVTFSGAEENSCSSQFVEGGENSGKYSVWIDLCVASIFILILVFIYSIS